MNRRINYIDLFSGIGGFALGLKKAGFIFENHWFSEIDKNAINIYKKHFPKAKELGDVRAIRDVSGLRADIITFGFPCQDLSVAGKRAGLAGSRSGLFFEAIRIIREIKPQCFIFENVKGLFTSDRGADFIRCLREIADIGLYDCEWQLVDSGWFLPQDRERIYFVGHLRGKSESKIFPFGSGREKVDVLQGQKANTLTARYAQSGNRGSFIVEDQRYRKDVEEKCCFGFYSKSSSHFFRGFIKEKSRTLKTRADAAVAIPVSSVNWLNKNQHGRRFKENGDNSFTLTTHDQHGVFDGKLVRRLTPLECERLQGFPDYWTDVEVLYNNGKIKKMYDFPRYKALGNAVSVCWPEWIGRKLLGDGNAE